MLYIGQWNIIYVIVSIILVIVALSNYILTQIQKSSECNEIISQLNRGDKLDEESKVINEKIDKYNKQISSYKQHENLPNSRYTQQIENMIADLKQISKINDEKIKMHNNRAESLKEKCNLAIEYR
jgi:predicted PurR-regulated permease PerM